MKTAKMLRIVGVAVGLVLAGLARPAGGTTWYVDVNGSGDFTTIQAALDDPCMVDGDEIEVAPGTYYEAIDFNDKAVRLYSSGGAGVTTIDANGAYHAVQCVSGEDANTILEGFTITGGNGNGSGTDGYGGGMYNYSSSPTVRDCNFTGNTASSGGGMYNDGSSSNPTVTNCIFSGNEASTEDGGGMANTYANPTVTNCVFTDNSAYDTGGAMANGYNSPTVTNCTFNQNLANGANGGGGMRNWSSNPTVTNCILWGNTPDEISNGGTSSPNVTYSDIQGGLAGTGNIDENPLFVDAGGGDLRLSSSASPCVDSGNNSAPTVGATDLAGNPRVVDGDLDSTATVDMGAYELQSKDIHNITQDAYYEMIQAAIDNASNGDKIEVGAGTYYEAINFNGKAITLRSTDPNHPSVVAGTIIDGTGNYHVVQCVSGEDANSILAGFTITGGNANGPDPNDQRGGGMYNYYSSPTVTDCNFSGNTASYGGGMQNWESSPTVSNCTFSGNSATSVGGGMYNYYSSPEVTNCVFMYNFAAAGGGIYNSWESSPEVTNCTFRGNSTDSAGAGMYNYAASNPAVTNCAFSDNQASLNAGGMRNNYYSSPTVTNCTFSGNIADANGGGICNWDNSSPTVTNCTFSGNSANFGGGMDNQNSSPTVTNCILWGDTPDEIYNSSSSPIVTYSDVEGGTGQSWFGIGCIDTDPCFVDDSNADPNLWNLQLAYGSACIDAGDNNSVPADTADLDGDGNTAEPIPFDLDGNPRVADGDADGSAVVDMGAYEWKPSPYAYDPNPADGAELVTKTPTLTWTAGLYADQHEVYFGTDYDDVNEATTASAEYIGIQDPCSWAPATLVLGQTYYWKITEVNDGYVGPLTPPWEGDVWSFRVEGHAYDPSPADGEVDVIFLGLELSWTAGAEAENHMLYFGTDAQAVADANTSSPEYLMTLAVGNESYGPGQLDVGRRYYWRVDEKSNGGSHIITGDVWSFRVEGHAYDPSPADGEVDVIFLGLELSWTAGAEAENHMLYFGTDAQAVEDATTSSAEYKGTWSVGNESYTLPGQLIVNKGYYWRIDEVNETAGTFLKGDVWSFTTGEFLIADDFEDYTNQSELWAVWDGYLVNGSDGAIYLENDGNIIREPNSQAASLEFINMTPSGPGYIGSWFDVQDLTELDIGSDWTIGGVKALVLYMRGDPYNVQVLPGGPSAPELAAGRPWVELEDTSSNVGYVLYPDANDILEDDWHEWNIDLGIFDACGVTLSAIDRFTIGIGGYAKTGPSGSMSDFGYIWVDDIRLYVPRCLPEYATASLDNDCISDFEDLKIMAEQWLTSGPEADIVDDDIVNFEDYGILGDNWLEELLWPPG